MTKKSFKSEYSELYLVTPPIYSKIMDSISDKMDRDELEGLNPPNATTDSVESNETTKVSTSEDDVTMGTSDSKENILTKLDELKNIILKDKGVNTEYSGDDFVKQTNEPILTSNNTTQTEIEEKVDQNTQPPTIITSKNSSKKEAVGSTSTPTQNTAKRISSKKFYCNICNHGFTRNYSRKRHINSKHGGVTAKNSSITPSKMNTEGSEKSKENIKKMNSRKRSSSSIFDDVVNTKKIKMSDPFSGKRKREEESISDEKIVKKT